MKGKEKRRKWGTLFHTLRFHILFPFILATLLTAVLVIQAASDTYTQTILRQENERNAYALSQIAQNISGQVSEVTQVSLLTALEQSVTNVVNGENLPDIQRVHARKKLLEQLNTTLNRYSNLYGLLFMRADGSLFGALPYRNFFTRDPFFLSDADKEAIAALERGQMLWLGPVSGEVIYQEDEEPKHQVSLILGVQKVNALSFRNGYVLTVLNTQSFGEVISAGADEDATTYLLLPDGREVLRTGAEGSLKAEQLQLQPENGQMVKNQGESTYVYRAEIGDLGWTLVREIPMAGYEAALKSMRRTVWLYAGGIFALVLLFYLLWLRHFLKTVGMLQEGMLAVGQGQMETRLEEPLAIREFESMRLAFNKMGQALQTAMEKNSRLEKESLELEMRNLQTTLSPHMIFNSITAISWMATMLGAERVSDMLSELSEMLRPVLREWHLQWTLGEEMAHLKHYARLLDLRYGNHFQLECRIPEEMNRVMLPRFTLQPLVENACEHGSRPREALTVVIEATEKEGWVELKVSNNGRSMTEEELERVRQILRSGERGTHIGIYNVYSRLAICMGKDSRLSVDTPESGGTLVTLGWKVKA